MSGIAHPNWKHGMYDGTLPTGLAAFYARARQNPALVELTEQIALVDAKVFELFEGLSRGESPQAWKRVRDLAEQQGVALAEFQAARKAFNGPGMQAAFVRLEAIARELMDVATKGVSDAKAWGVIVDQIELRRKLVNSEVRRQKQASDTMLKKQVLGLIGYIAASIAKHVKDPSAKQAVNNDIRRLMGGREVDGVVGAQS